MAGLTGDQREGGMTEAEWLECTDWASGRNVTEQEWLECKDPLKMLVFLRVKMLGLLREAVSEKVSDRKPRLLGCACCHRLWHLLSDERSRKALSIAERYADGEVSAEKLGYAWGDARRAAQVAHRQERQTAEGAAMYAVAMLCQADIGRALEAVHLAAGCEAYSLGHARLADIHNEQIPLLRDLFGNPFQPVALDSALRTPAVVQLARSLYEEKRFEDLPVLADALEEAGCQDATVLEHCRGPGPHVKGCWVLDLLLGKE